jgi:hypothetical protein
MTYPIATKEVHDQRFYIKSQETHKKFINYSESSEKITTSVRTLQEKNNARKHLTRKLLQESKKQPRK